MGVDGMAAAGVLLGLGRVDPGYCLYYVWRAYKAVGAQATTDAATAYIGWQRSGGHHEGDWNPPPGVPVWFGPKASSAAGDVVISLGGGEVACTDWPYSGVVGRTTIAQRQNQIGRPYLGWTEDILGAAIDLGGGNAEPEKEEEMSYSLVKDANSDTIWLVSHITGNYVGVGNPYHLNLLRRVKKNDANDPMLEGELAITRGYFVAANPPAGVTVDIPALAKALSAVMPSTDAAAIRKAVKDALSTFTFSTTVATT